MRRGLAVVMVLCLSTVQVAVADAPLPSARPAKTESGRGDLAKPLALLVDEVREAGGSVGVAVVDLDTGKLVLEHEAELPLNPASNMKLLTAWAALRQLGPQHRYLTAIHGKLEGSRLPRAALRGDGDPSLDHRDLWELAARLSRDGVRSVGDIVVDQSHFDDQYAPPVFEEQPGEWASFRAPVAAVSVAGNTVSLEVRPASDGQPARVSAVPASFVDLAGTVQTRARDATETVRLGLVPSGERIEATLGGSLPEGNPTVVLVRRVEDPRLLAGYALRDILQGMGIAVEGKVSLEPARSPVLHDHTSAPLGTLLHELGKSSNNFYAEMIFKSLSVAQHGPPASFERSSEVMRQLLVAAGIDTQKLVIKNGSGLFDANRASALVIARLLEQAIDDPRTGPDFVAQLAIAGADGTLRARFRGVRADSARRGTIRAKTGTLAKVTALSGYVLGARRYAFAILVNNVPGGSVSLRPEMDGLVEALAVNEPSLQP